MANEAYVQDEVLLKKAITVDGEPAEILSATFTLKNAQSGATVIAETSAAVEENLISFLITGANGGTASAGTFNQIWKVDLEGEVRSFLEKLYVKAK